MDSSISLGVTLRDGRLSASCSGEGCDWIKILYREKGGAWHEHKLEADPLYPSIFSGSFSADSQKQYEYIFESDKGYFLDDHAALTVSPARYGKLGELEKQEGIMERNIFSDTLNRVCSVETEVFDWKKDRRPFVKASDMIAYKLHVRGFTIHESSKIKHPGTYKGVCEKISYLKSLGITTVILQPCYEFNELMDFHINIGTSPSEDIQRSRVFSQPAETIPGSRLNFWGYGAQGLYFAPKAAYAAEPERAVREFKNMVRSLHTAGMEVIMEIDYERSMSDSFILENLRFWALEYHIDGFRMNTERISTRLVSTDVVLRNIKLFCRNFNDDYQGRDRVRDRIFISNDGFQDCIRRFLKGDEGQLLPAANLLKENGGRYGKINYVADHDGFTLNDAFSYDERHNEANGEGNRDGREANYSWNCGAEGPTKKHKVLDLRNRMIKNALVLLFLSQGIPMICAGDEFGNTHEGNNNPYCCDNEQGWVIWNKTKRATDIKTFVMKLISLRKEHPVFRNDKALSGNDFEFTGCPDVSFHGTKAWYPDFGYYSRTLGVLLNGAYADADIDSGIFEKTEPVTDSEEKEEAGIIRKGKDLSFLLLINTHWEAHEFSLPVITGYEWDFVFSTHPMVKSGIRVGREQKELILPRTICLYTLKKQVKVHPDPTESSADDKEDITPENTENVSSDKVTKQIKPEDLIEITQNYSRSIFEDEDDADPEAEDEVETEPSESEAAEKPGRGIRPDLDDEESA